MLIYVTYNSQEEIVVIDAGECTVSVRYLDNISVISEVTVNFYITPVINMPHASAMTKCMQAFELWSAKHANEQGQFHDNESHCESFEIA